MTDASRSHHRLRLYAVLAVVALLILAALWRWTPLNEFAEPRVIAQWLRTAAKTGWLPVLIGVGFVVGNALMFPNTVMCLGVILALGSYEGFFYATGGSMLAAIVAYIPARKYGPASLKGLKVKSLDRVSAALRRGNTLQVLTLRLMPIAPFPVVNIMAGAAKVRVVPYVVGTFLGLLPGNLLFSAFGRQLRRLISDPAPETIAALVAVMVVGSAMLWYLHRLATAPARD